MLRAVMAWVLAVTVAGAQEKVAATRYDTPFGAMWTQNVGPEGMTVKYRLWFGYSDADNDYLDQLDYLLSMRARWQAEGVQIGVVLPTVAAKQLVATEPPVLVLAPAPDDEQANSNLVEQLNGRVFLMNDDDVVLCAMPTADGIEDVLRALTSSKGFRNVVLAKTQLETLVQNVADGGNFDRSIEQCLKALPKSGRAHAAKVLYFWWCKGDLQAARTAVEVALVELADHSLPLCQFADLVVRGDHEDAAIAGLVAKAIAPIAKDAKHGAFTQLVFLRALLKSRGDSRTAGRVAATLPRRLKGRPYAQVVFAETVMDAETPLIYRDAAEQALKSVEGHSELKRWVFCARHKILKRCGDDEGAKKLMEIYRKDPVGRGDLNNDAWHLMVQPQTMGRFDSLALAQTQQMQAVQGLRISANSKDTAALAFFRNDHLEEAIALAKETNPKANSAYLGRLTRYEAVLAQRKSNKPPARANK